MRLPAHLSPIQVHPTRPPRPLTREQVARVLGRHPRTVDRWARLGLALGVVLALVVERLTGAYRTFRKLGARPFANRTAADLATGPGGQARPAAPTRA